MTVEELIEKLKQMPQDFEVWLSDESGYEAKAIEVFKAGKRSSKIIYIGAE